MFQSVVTLAISSFLTLVLILFLSLRKNPFPIISNFFVDLFHQRLLLAHFLGVLSILALNKIEISLKSHLPDFPDWTPFIMKLEGEITPLLQLTLHNDLLTYISTYFYVIVFSVLMVASLLIYHHENNQSALYAIIYGISLNYFLAVPFFMLIPVYEAWTLHPELVFLIPEVYPNFEGEYRFFSALDNSFPSLHTSLSLTMVMIAYRSGNVRFAWITAISCGWILFGIIYLGIHWYVDMIAGGLFAWVCVKIAYRLSRFPLEAHNLLSQQKKRATSEFPSGISS